MMSGPHTPTGQTQDDSAPVPPPSPEVSPGMAVVMPEDRNWPTPPVPDPVSQWRGLGWNSAEQFHSALTLLVQRGHEAYVNDEPRHRPRRAPNTAELHILFPAGDQDPVLSRRLAAVRRWRGLR